MDYSKKYKKNSGRSFPYVNFFDCNDLKLKFIDWFGNDKLINETVGLLVLRLDVLNEEENIIEFCCYNKEDNSFKCIINDKDIYMIKINNLDDKDKNKEIVVINNDIECTYKCEEVNNIELGMKVILSSYKRDYLGGLVKLEHYLSRDYVIYDLDYMDYHLKFKVLRPDNVKLSMFDDNGRYARYVLDNEEELINYLVNEGFKIDLVDIFKLVCEISLGNDISSYPEIYLEMSYGKEKNILDLIHLKYGELERVGLTNVDKGYSLFFNKDNSWEYKNFSNELLVMFSMIVNGNNINYNVSVNNDSDMSLVMDMIRKNIVDANREKEKVKVLSRKIIGMNNNSN